MTMEELNGLQNEPSWQLEQLMRGDPDHHVESVLFKAAELLDGKPPTDAIRVDGIVRNFAFHPARLAASRATIEHIIKGVVADEFFKSKGGGYSFLALCNDRDGTQWAEHPTMEVLVALSIGLGLAGYCLPREFWNAFPGGMPYVWFADLQAPHA